MRLLLDTHTLLWATGDISKLSAAAVDALDDPDNALFVSAVSAFEITTKYRIGKLPGAELFARDFQAALAPLDCSTLPITIGHGAHAGTLTFAHKDPFDRLLIAQAAIEGLTLVSNERLFDEFGVSRLW